MDGANTGVARFVSEWGTLLLTIVVVVAAFLVNRFAPKKRRHVRRAVVLLLLFLLATAGAYVLGRAGMSAAQSLRTVAELCGIFTTVTVAGVIVFYLVLPALRVDLATIVIDLSMGAAYLVSAFVVMRRAGVDLSGIVTTSAVVTGILALSLQTTLGNVIGGVALQLDSSVRVGDWIQLENGKQGRVREIRWRHTVIETRDWDTIVVPNASLLAANILILGKREGAPLQHRMWVYFNVDFRHSPSDVIEAVEAALHSAPIDGVAAEPKPNCVCMDFARDNRDSFGYYAVRYWLKDMARDDPTSSKVRERLYAALKRAGIPLAVPAAQIWVEQDSEARRERKHKRELARRLKALEAVEFLKVLREDELAAVAEGLLYAPFAAGETVTRQGAIAHWLYIVADGAVEVRVASKGGEQTVAEIKAPGFFGEQGLMTGEPRNATIVAKTDVECYRLDKETFEKIVAERPEAATEVADVLAKRRVELEAVRDHLDAAARQSRLAAEKSKLLATIQRFFGLDEERSSTTSNPPR